MRMKKSMSPVKRGWPWNATACPPTTRFSTLREFNNPMNSLKSLCRCAKRTPLAFDQLEQQVEPFLGCQVGVELIVGLVGSVEALENLGDAFHKLILPEGRRTHQDPPAGLSRERAAASATAQSA